MNQPMTSRVDYARHYVHDAGISERYSLSGLKITAPMLEKEGLLGLKPWIAATILLDLNKRIQRRKHGHGHGRQAQEVS